jgi:hypothetical protein
MAQAEIEEIPNIKKEEGGFLSFKKGEFGTNMGWRFRCLLSHH